MLFLRSLAFNIAFYVNLSLWAVAGLVTLVLPSRVCLGYAKAWGRSNLWLLRVLAGIRVEFRGLDRIPTGGLLVAAKHQSAWETFALLSLFDKPTFILKRELIWVPFFGALLHKSGMIPVNRTGGVSAMSQMTRRARAALAAGRQVIIFPEGTRRPPGAPPDYKSGAAYLYRQTGVACLPIALNSGLFWPRQAFLKRPGTIVVEILDLIPPGEPRNRFLSSLMDRIETASDRLLLSPPEQRRSLKVPGRRLDAIDP